MVVDNAIERVLRILSGIHYVDEAGPGVYIANTMTREMTTPFAIARSKFMYVLCASSLVMEGSNRLIK